MSIRDCIVRARDGGELTPEEAEDLLKRFDGFDQQYRLEMGPDEAERAAKAALADEMRAQAAETRRRSHLAWDAANRIGHDAKTHKNARGKIDVVEGVLSHLERRGWSKHSSIDGRSRSIIALVHGELEELLYEFRRSAVSGKTKNIARLDNVVRELHGKGTGDVRAGELAKAWSTVTEKLRQRFNAAGGNIADLKGWGLPQHHDALAVRRAGPEKWKKAIRPMLDREKMISPLTGKRLNDAELEEALDYSWRSITTDGWAHKDPKMISQGKGSMARRHGDHRFLHFKDADNWLDYAKEFGGRAGWSREDVAWHSMMHHVRSMSEDIAAMEVLGPNPEAMLEWMKQTMRKEASKVSEGKSAALPNKNATIASARATTAEYQIDKLWDVYTGKMDVPVPGKVFTLGNVDFEVPVAEIGATIRNAEISSKLGAAMFSAISDPGFQSATRTMAGADRSGLHLVIKDVVSQFQMKSKREAVQAGMILDSALNLVHQESRYFGTISGPQWSRTVADRTLTWSGLLPWTQATKHAFGMEMFATMANHAGKSFDELAQTKYGVFDLKTTMERFGISSADWDILRATKLYDAGKGAMILRPSDVARRGGINQQVAERYLEMVQELGRLATPEGSLGTVATLKGGSQPGTFVGETARATAMFKSFSIAVMVQHGGNVMAELAAGNKARGAIYAGAALIGTTMLAGLGLQLSQISKGLEPRDMSDPKFWAAAGAKGGGLGLFGDFLYADHSRYGGGFWQHLLGGPVVGTLDKATKLTLGNAAELLQGKETNAGRELVDFLRSETPMGSLWYTRAAYERLFLDQLQKYVDPDAHRSFRKKQQYYQKNFNQSYWFEPGQAVPQSPPDLTTAFGGSGR